MSRNTFLIFISVAFRNHPSRLLRTAYRQSLTDLSPPADSPNKQARENKKQLNKYQGWNLPLYSARPGAVPVAGIWSRSPSKNYFKRRSVCRITHAPCWQSVLRANFKREVSMRFVYEIIYTFYVLEADQDDNLIREKKTQVYFTCFYICKPLYEFHFKYIFYKSINAYKHNVHKPVNAILLTYAILI